MSISTSELTKAVASLKDSLILYQNTNNPLEKKAFRDACIQRFEYCIEFSWKLSVRILGSTAAAAKPAIREMARNNLISNPDIWIDFIDARNNTSHSYDEDVAQKVFIQIQKFLPQVEALIVELQKVLK